MPPGECSSTVPTEGGNCRMPTAVCSSAVPTEGSGCRTPQAPCPTWKPDVSSDGWKYRVEPVQTRPFSYVSSGWPEHTTCCVSANPCKIQRQVSRASNQNRSPYRGNGHEHVNVLQSQTRQACDAHKEDTSLLKQILEKIDNLGCEIKKDVEKHEDSLESKALAGPDQISAGTQSPLDLQQANFGWSVRALEECKQDHVKTTADFEQRIFALEERVAALTGICQIHQDNNNKLKIEFSRLKTYIEKQTYQLEERLGVLQETILHNQVAHSKNMTELKASFENDLALVKKGMSSSFCMQAPQNIKHHDPKQQPELATIETRLGDVEGNMDLIACILRSMETKFSDAATEVPVRKMANGGHVGFNGQIACSSFATLQEPGIIQRASVEDCLAERLAALHARAVSRSCYTIREDAGIGDPTQ